MTTLEKRKLLAFCLLMVFCTLALALFCCGPGPQPSPWHTEGKGYSVTTKVPVTADLQASGGPVTIHGVLNLYLKTDDRELKSGTLSVGGFNLVFFDVPQQRISGQPTDQSLGTLGIVLSNAGAAALQYNADEKTVTGTIPVETHFSQLDEIFPPDIPDSHSRSDDLAFSKTQPGTLSLTIRNIDLIPIPEKRFQWIRGGKWAPGTAILAAGPLIDDQSWAYETTMESSAHITVDEFTDQTGVEAPGIASPIVTIPKYIVKIGNTPSTAQVADQQRSDIIRTVHVHPVRVGRRSGDPAPYRGRARIR